MFRVNVGEENIHTFTVNDTDDFNVTIEGGAPEGGVLTDGGDGEYTFTWTPGVIPNISGLAFIATDSSGAATLHSPSVQVCACFNGGECTEEGVLSTNNLIVILTCLCDEGKVEIIIYKFINIILLQHILVKHVVKIQMDVRRLSVSVVLNVLMYQLLV